ncbi:hypothetical protein O4H66_25560 [Comamonadaceae bacterium G21597-S1]|nr:hypothetical protein [Comamonadaceae bacterium G21597-S1]
MAWRLPRLLGAVLVLAATTGAGAQTGFRAPGDDGGVELRRPQGEPLVYPLPPIDPNQVSPPTRADPRISLPVPDRWRIMESLGQTDRWWDPYNINTIKGDKPFESFAAWGPDWFLNLGAISDTLMEWRAVPTPVGAQLGRSAGANNVLAGDTQRVTAQTVILTASIVKGNTTFKPPDYEFKLVGAFNVNHARVSALRALRIDPQRGSSRTDRHFGLQEAFVDVHLRNVSDQYDFDSLRVGIQPIISDFRGFIFNDTPLAVRLFGTRDNNRWQYNLAAFQRFEKDTNSGLNDVFTRLRSDYTLMANAYRQDWPVLGHTTQATVLYNINREGNQGPYYDNNGFIARPAVIGDGRRRNYEVAYLGLNGDGHFGRWNLTSSAYLAMGSASYDPIAQRSQKIRAGFGAAELSRDFDWIRVRGTALVASADRDPFDGQANGFDAIFENPQIAGADTSYWIRQAVPLVGGGGLALSGRNGVLGSLRTSKEQGQSNFVNPGLRLIGIGADIDLAPQWRLIGNLNWLSFGNTSVLQVLRNQGGISRDIGIDMSLALQYRPFMSQNVIFNFSMAWLQPGDGYRQLFASDKRPYSVLANLLLVF